MTQETLRLATLEAALHTLSADLRAAGEDDRVGPATRTRFHLLADGLSALGFAPLPTGPEDAELAERPATASQPARHWIYAPLTKPRAYYQGMTGIGPRFTAAAHQP